MLNPSEHYMDYLIGNLNALVQVLSTLNGNYDKQAYYDTLKEIEDLQQIILKSEWKRVKAESNTGKELSDKDIDELYNSVAETINKDLYKKVNEWISLEQESLDVF